MAIVPAGKTHVMKTQKFANPLSEGFGMRESLDSGAPPEVSPSFETEGAMEDDVTPDVSNEIDEPQQSPVEGKKTLTNYVYKKLQSYGYPGRRLEEFKSKFVRESLSPEGIKDIQVELPDKKYSEQGMADSIDHAELKEISQEINRAFGLNFNGAEHVDGKWTIKFTSQKITSEDEQQGTFRDGLDEVYGTPARDKKEEPKAVKAYTITEMIKKQKDDMVSKLKSIIGERHDTKNVKST
jgi:hypothetical protein